jgi:hypothetical protein
MQAFTRRRWNSAASGAVSKAIACSRTPGVPKSLVLLPMAMTRIS